MRASVHPFPGGAQRNVLVATIPSGLLPPATLNCHKSIYEEGVVVVLPRNSTSHIFLQLHREELLKLAAQSYLDFILSCTFVHPQLQRMIYTATPGDITHLRTCRLRMIPYSTMTHRNYVISLHMTTSYSQLHTTTPSHGLLGL